MPVQVSEQGRVSGGKAPLKTFEYFNRGGRYCYATFIDEENKAERG